MIQRAAYLLGSSSNAAPVAVSGNSNAFPAYDLDRAQINAVVTDLTPAAKDFTANATTNVLTAAANGLQLGQVFQVSNSGGALPGGLSAITDYYAIPLNGDQFKVASSYNNAIAGTAVDITDAGTGTNTETPTALSGGTATLQGAQMTQNQQVIAASFADIPNTAQDISGLGSFNWDILNTDYPFYRITITDNDAGTLGLVITFNGKTIQ